MKIKCHRLQRLHSVKTAFTFSTAIVIVINLLFIIIIISFFFFSTLQIEVLQPMEIF